MKTYYQLHKNYWKKYYSNHKREIRLYYKKYQKEHKKAIAKINKKYKQNHKQKINKIKKIYLQNPINKLIYNYRTRIWQALKRNLKSAKTEKLLGCSIIYFANYIQKQFKVGMSWKNYGKWHIDHIKPCASFDLSKKSEQLKCFNYKNLRPLWAKENLERNKKCVGIL